jgi:hypothetical protein
MAQAVVDTVPEYGLLQEDLEKYLRVVFPGQEFSVRVSRPSSHCRRVSIAQLESQKDSSQYSMTIPRKLTQVSVFALE